MILLPREYGDTTRDGMPPLPIAVARVDQTNQTKEIKPSCSCHWPKRRPNHPSMRCSGPFPVPRQSSKPSPRLLWRRFYFRTAVQLLAGCLDVVFMPLLCCPHVNHDLNRLLYVRVQQRNLGVRGVSLPVCMHQPYVVAPRIQLVIVGRNVAVTPKPVLPLFYFFGSG